MERLKASRRDAELTRQMLLALRYVLPSKRPNRRRPRLAGRDFLDDALRLAELVSDAEAVDAALVGRPIIEVNSAATGAPSGDGAGDSDAIAAAQLAGGVGVDGLPGEEFSEDELPPELESTLDRDCDRRRRRGRGDSRRPDEPRQSPGLAASSSAQAFAPSSTNGGGRRPEYLPTARVPRCRPVLRWASR